MRSLFRKSSWLSRHCERVAALREELQFHLEEEAEQRQAQGFSAEEAKWAARRELGNLLLVEERTRAVWGWRFLGGGNMRDFLADIRYSMRLFRKSPGFTATAVLALALGIGATTAIFSIVNAVLLRPLPVRDPDRFMVLVTRGVDQGPRGYGPAGSPVKFWYVREHSNVLEDVTAFRGGTLNYTGGDIVEQVPYLQVSADAFQAFGIPILRGRIFTPVEDAPHGPRVAIIGEQFWNRRFGSDPQIVGKAIALNGETYTVVGVVKYNPAWLEWGPEPGMYLPLQLDPSSTDVGNTFQVYARLKRGVSLERARAQLQAETGPLRARFPTAIGLEDVLSVMPFKELLIGDTRQALFVLLGAVGLVLLIACANVANLLLVRATGRRREIAIRAAIGAGRRRMIRQLLTESLLLSLAGGALGLLLGYSGIRALLAVNTAGLPRVGDEGVAVWFDWRLLAFGAGISLVTGIVFGLLPALQGSRADLSAVLKESSGRSGTGFRQNQARSVLVVSEVGLAVMLLVGAALLIETFQALYSVKPGFDTTNVLTLRMSMTGQKYQRTAGVANTIRIAEERIRAVPGAVATSATCCLPMQGGLGLPFNVVGRPTSNDPFTGFGRWSVVAPGFFDVFRIPVKRGRVFTERDDGQAPAVAIINEKMAEQYWKDGDPLGDRIVIGRGILRQFQDEPPRQIIGIVGDIHDGGLGRDPSPAIYVPQSQLTNALNSFVMGEISMTWLVRTQGSPNGLAAAVEAALREATGLPISNVRSMDQVVSLSTARQRFNMLLMTVFGALALLLAAIGIYGLMAYSVAQRQQEIGIRMALGAEAAHLRNIVVKQGMALVLVGMTIGLTAAWVAKMIQSFLFGVQARDVRVFVAVPVVFTTVAFVAVWLPAYRAGKVSPMQCLRHE
jgi:putative ABC transport system permease protein